MSDTVLFPQYTTEAATFGDITERVPMQVKSPYTLLLRTPQASLGTRRVYLLPKAVAEFNKSTGKGLVV